MTPHTTGRNYAAEQGTTNELAEARGCSCSSGLVDEAIKRHTTTLYERVMCLYSGRERGHNVESVREYFEGLPWKCLKDPILRVLLESALRGKGKFEKIFGEVQAQIPLPKRGEQRVCHCENDSIGEALSRWFGELELH